MNNIKQYAYVTYIPRVYNYELPFSPDPYSTVVKEHECGIFTGKIIYNRLYDHNYWDYYVQGNRLILNPEYEPVVAGTLNTLVVAEYEGESNN